LLLFKSFLFSSSFSANLELLRSSQSFFSLRYPFKFLASPVLPLQPPENPRLSSLFFFFPFSDPCPMLLMWMNWPSAHPFGAQTPPLLLRPCTREGSRVLVFFSFSSPSFDRYVWSSVEPMLPFGSNRLTSGLLRLFPLPSVLAAFNALRYSSFFLYPTRFCKKPHRSPTCDFPMPSSSFFLFFWRRPF